MRLYIKLDTRLNWLLTSIRHIFEWYGVSVTPRTDTKNTCLKETRLRVQNMITILGPIFGDLYDHLMSTRIFNLIMNKIFI